jgi:hypothetical protein
MNSFWGEKSPCLGNNTTTHDCWQQNIQSNQEATQWNVILFQLYYGCTIYKAVCLFKFKWNYNPMEFT